MVFNFAAETHVDNSIFDPNAFIKSNVLGLSTLLQNCYKNEVKDFYSSLPMKSMEALRKNFY